jgi:anti-anti-sigma factor
MADLNDGEAGLDVDVRLGDGGVMIVAVNGELDLATAGVLEETLASADATNASRIVFDMSGVEFMDSSGIAVLIRAAARDGFVEISRPSTVVALVIEATGLTDVLRVTP